MSARSSLLSAARVSGAGRPYLSFPLNSPRGLPNFFERFSMQPLILGMLLFWDIMKSRVASQRSCLRQVDPGRNGYETLRRY